MGWSTGPCAKIPRPVVLLVLPHPAPLPGLSPSRPRHAQLCTLVFVASPLACSSSSRRDSDVRPVVGFSHLPSPPYTIRRPASEVHRRPFTPLMLGYRYLDADFTIRNFTEYLYHQWSIILVLYYAELHLLGFEPLTQRDTETDTEKHRDRERQTDRRGRERGRERFWEDWGSQREHGSYQVGRGRFSGQRLNCQWELY